MAFIYDSNKDWALNAQILANQINSTLTPQDVFAKNRGIVEYALYKKAVSVIQGCCYYLREQGFLVSESMENEIVEKLSITLDYNTQPDAATAATAKENNKVMIYVNAGHNLVAKCQTGGEMYSAVLGFFYHELGHVLFSSFPTLRAWQNSMRRGVWFPKAPSNINTPNGIALQAAMTTPGFAEAFAMILGSMQNALEDGYIENELVAMYPGAVRQALATINSQLLDGMPSVSETLDTPEGCEFDAIHTEILRYAKFAEMNFGNNCPEELREDLEDIALTIDDARVERHPEKRMELTNEIAVEIYPYLEEKIFELAKHIEQQNQNQQNQQAQQGQGQQGQGGAGGTGGGQSGIGSIPQNILSQVLEKLTGGAQNSASNAGVNGNSDGNMTSEGLSNASSNKNKRKSNLPNAKEQHKGSGSGGQGKDAGQGNGSGAGSGARTGDSFDAAAERDFENLKEEISNKKAMQLTEEARTQDMNDQLKNMQRISDVNKDIRIKRASEVSEQNIQSFNKNATYFERIAADLTRSMKQILKDRREGGRRKNLVMGRRFEANHYCLNDDYRDFSKIKWPTESPTLSFGVLVDESGSTSGECIDAATKAAIILELFASKEHGLDIKHIISGYTTGGWSTCEIRSYSEPDKIDNSDVYRITGMNSSGGTPTCAAMNYMKERLNGLRTDVKIMIVISDGESGDNKFYDDGDTLLKRIISECRKDKIMVVAAGIGRDRESVGKEFGEDNFLDISNLELMPTELADIIKRQLWV